MLTSICNTMKEISNFVNIEKMKRVKAIYEYREKKLVMGKDMNCI